MHPFLILEATIYVRMYDGVGGGLKGMEPPPVDIPFQTGSQITPPGTKLPGEVPPYPLRIIV